MPDSRPLGALLQSKTPLVLFAVLLLGSSSSPVTAQSPAAATPATSGAHAPRFNPRDLTGVWLQERGRPFKKFPLNPEYQKILDKRLADAAAGRPFQVPKDTCLPSGLFASMTSGGYPIEIYYQADREIFFQKEIIGALYRVYLKRAHKTADDLRPLFYGDSIGHWDGDVLVIDTISLGGSEALDLIGTPHSDALHVVQRLHRVNYDTIEDTLTADDSKAFTQPITGTVKFRLQADLELDEFECTNERNVTNTNGTQTIVPSTDSTALTPAN